MAKSRGRKFAELVAPTNGVFAAASIPTIALSKLASSAVTINSESLSLGGSLTLDTSDIGEHTSNKYFTDARAQATLSVASNSGHGALAYDNSNGQFTFAGITTEAIQDVVGAMFSSNTETAVTVTYQDSDGTIDLVVDDTTKVPLAGGTMTGNLTLGDNVNAYFGASTDLRIYHDGTNSHIINSTGELRFTGSNFAIKSDSAKLYLGAGDDLKIYHTGSHSYIENGTGTLFLDAAQVNILDGANTAAAFTAAGATTLYHNGSAKLATTSGGVTVTGGLTATALAVNSGGSTSDLSGTAIFRIMGGDVRITNAAGSEAMATFAADGAVTLYHDSSAKLATTSTGVQTTGTLNVNGAYSFPTSDGTNGQVLQTDGSGNLTFVTGGGGAGDITAVVAGTNLTGGATSGSATVNLAGSLTSISKITFTNSNVQAPTTSDATTGARLVLYSNGSGRDYSIGIEADTMWFNSDDNYKWYADGTLKFEWDNSAGQLEIGGNKVWHAGNDGTGSGLDADTVDGIQASSFLRSDTNDSVGTDVRHDYGPNSTWSSTLRIGGNGYTAGQSNSMASVVTTNGNLHLDAGGNRGLYLNHYSGTGGVAFGSGSSGAVAWMGPDGDLWKGSADNTGSKYWHAGNDGSGSGLDADLLDGLSSEDFARLGNYTSTFGGTPSSSNRVRFDNASGQSMNSSSGYLSRLECFQATAGADAFMTFHVGGDYAVYFGLDGGTNDLSVGGWSMGANKYKVWHSGNDGSGSGLDADTLDGTNGGAFMKTGAGDAVTGWWIASARNGNSGSPQIYFSHSGGYGQHINTYNTSGSVYALQVHNNSKELLGVYNDGSVKVNGGHLVVDVSSTYSRKAGGIQVGSTSSLTNSSSQLALAGNNPYISFHDGSGARTAYFQETGGRFYAGEVTYSESVGSYRAPIFYDVNNTAYYTDQANVSRMNNIRPDVVSTPASGNATMFVFGTNSGSPNHINLGGSSSDPAAVSNSVGISWGTRSDNNGYYLIGVHNYANGYSTHSRLRLAWHTGVELGGNPTYGGVRIFEDSPWVNSTEQARFMGSNGIVFSRSLTDTADIRAPLFYDSNNTAYYADIAGTSRYNYIRPNDISCVGNVDYGNPRWDFRAHVVESPHHYATTATETMYIGEDNTINLRDHAIAEDDCRAPIFYHSTNTTYYVRPGSSSKFAGDIFIDGNHGVGIVGVYSATRYQHVWSMGAAYRTNAAGTSYGNMYGLTYTHTNIGTGTNQSIAGLSHQLQHRTNGTLTAAIGAGIWTSGNVTAYSDIAVKTNLQVIPNALEKVCSLHGYTYERTDYVKDPEDPNAPDKLVQAGVVAQEVEKVLPEVVSGSEGNKNVAYGNMVSILIEAIKELKTEVDELKAQLNKEK